MSRKVVEQSDLGDLAKAIHNNDPLTADNISDLEDLMRHETWELWHTILFIYLYYFLIFVAFVECVLSLLFDLKTPIEAIGKFIGLCFGFTLSWKLPSRLWIKLWKFSLYELAEKLFGKVRTPLDFAKE